MAKVYTLENYLVGLHTGGWFGFSDSKNKVYANLIIHNDSKSKPSESDCTTGLATLQSDFDTRKTNEANKKASAISKLKALGLDDEEIKSLRG